MTEQSSLFDQNSSKPDSKIILFQPDLSQWRQHAKQALAEKRHPDTIHWQGDHHAEKATSGRALSINVPKSYAEALNQAQWHSDPQRWDLFYRLLWRLHNGDSGLMQKRHDDQRQRLHRLVRQVNRDLHKMKAFLRFEPIEQNSEEHFYAWFEPDHLILKPGAQFFRRRFSNMHWTIQTHEGIAQWTPGDALKFSGPQPKLHTGDDPTQDLWHRYYQSTFNPARLKVGAMLNEMPKKYWRNMPETQHISQMIKSSTQRTGEMLEKRKEHEQLNCGPKPEPNKHQ